MRVKSPAKWGLQIAEMIFQTRSKIPRTVFVDERKYIKRIPYPQLTGTESFYPVYKLIILPENDILFLCRTSLLLSGKAVRNGYR